MIRKILAPITFSLLTSVSTMAQNVPWEDVFEHVQCQEKECQYLQRHFKKDSLKECRVDPEKIDIIDITVNTDQGPPIFSYLHGKIRYILTVRGAYHYEVYIDLAGTVHVTSKVYFKNADRLSGEELKSFDERMAEAEKVWEDHSPYPFPVDFHFVRVEEEKDAYYSVKFKDSTSGPYFKNWSHRWPAKIIAHEMGHIFGLDDEYKNRGPFSHAKDCPKSSLMCLSLSGQPQSYHYYVIFRRLFCQDRLELNHVVQL